MTPLELLKKGKVAVRKSATLYPLYQQAFNEIFGRFPECPTCGSAQGKRDWNDFESYVKGADPDSINLKNQIMVNSNLNFKIKNRIKIYRYVNKDGRVVRVYGDQMTEDFAIGYLADAENNPEEFQKRKLEFSLLPEKFRETSKEPKEPKEPKEEKLPTSLKDLKALAVERKYPEAEWADIKTIADMTDYVKTQQVVADL